MTSCLKKEWVTHFFGLRRNPHLWTLHQPWETPYFGQSFTRVHGNIHVDGRKPIYLNMFSAGFSRPQVWTLVSGCSWWVCQDQGTLPYQSSSMVDGSKLWTYGKSCNHQRRSPWLPWVILGEVAVNDCQNWLKLKHDRKHLHFIRKKNCSLEKVSYQSIFRKKNRSL